MPPTPRTYQQLDNLKTHELIRLVVNKKLQAKEYIEVLKLALIRDSKELLQDLTYSSDAPEKVLRILALNKDYETVRAGVASNPKTPLDVLKNLMGDDSYLVICHIAQNNNITREILDSIIQRFPKTHSNFDLYYFIVSNHKTPNDVLEDIYDSPIGERLSFDISLNPNASSDLLGDLYSPHSKDSDLYRSLADNPKTPTQILRFLYKDYGNLVSSRLTSNPSTPADILISIYKELGDSSIEDLSDNPSTPPSVLEDIFLKYKGRENSVYLSLLADLTVGGEDSYWDDTLKNLMGNPNTPKHVIKELKDIIASKKNREIEGYKATKKIPSIDYSNKGMANKINSDLELLKRLKGYIS